MELTFGRDTSGFAKLRKILFLSNWKASWIWIMSREDRGVSRRSLVGSQSPGRTPWLGVGRGGSLLSCFSELTSMPE